MSILPIVAAVHCLHSAHEEQKVLRLTWAVLCVCVCVCLCVCVKCVISATINKLNTLTFSSSFLLVLCFSISFLTVSACTKENVDPHIQSL